MFNTDSSQFIFVNEKPKFWTKILIDILENIFAYFQISGLPESIKKF